MSGRPRPLRVLRAQSLRTRLLLFVGATLVVVSTAMACTTAFVQRAYLMGDLDDRVAVAADRSLAGAVLRPDDEDDLSYLTGNGHPAGLLAARLDEDGSVRSAAVVGAGAPQLLSPVQRVALAGVATDGSTHTRAVPGLGTYRVTGAESAGTRVLTGLPMDDVQHLIGGLVRAEAGVAGAGLALAVGVCAVVIRRELRPLGRVAATAVEVSRAPLSHGEATGLPRVPERDTDPGSEAGQVGAALNRMIDHVESSIAERLRSEERVCRSEERMRRFLADASHELRTPLASIAGYAELMNRGTGPVEPVLAWRRVSAESARMTGLVEDLLLLARLDEGRPLQSAEVDMTALVAEAVWDARAAGRDHVWQLDLRLDGPALVVGDETRLHQMVAGLLANACMHTPVGTTVVASVEATTDRCVVRVRDNGPGIPPSLLPRVFERFTRGDTSRSRTDARAGGSGLGLAIAAAITTAHGGHVDVHSVPGHTEFTIDLPTAADSTGVQATADSTEAQAARSRPASV